jgi:CBS domain-containing protein
MKTVRSLLQKKGHTVTVIGPNDSVLAAMQKMTANNIGALLVTKDEKLVGILTERDFSRKAYLIDKPVKDMLVMEIMTRQVAYVGLDYTDEECMALMTEIRARHLPVLDEGKIVGILSIGDLVKDVVSQQDFVIQQLIQYIYDTKEI